MRYGWSDDGGSSGGGGMRSTGYSRFEKAREAYVPPTSSRTSGKSSSRRVSEKPAKRPVHSGGRTESPVGKTLHTESTHPLVIGFDVTQSMDDKPGILLKKLGAIQELARYVPDYAISFFGMGDSQSRDRYPLQVRDFDSGPPLDDHLLQIYPEAGGGVYPESYGLPPYYYINHCEMPNAVKPMMIMVLDAVSHTYVTPREIEKHTGDVVQHRIKTIDLFAHLQEKFTLYILLFEEENSEAHEHWKKMVNPQRIVIAEDPSDIVEMIIGIYAGEMGMFEDFQSRCSERHSDMPARLDRVFSSLVSVAEKSKMLSVTGGDGVRLPKDKSTDWV